MNRLKMLVQCISGLIKEFINPIGLSEFRKQFINYQALVNKLLIAEQQLTIKEDRSRGEHIALRDEAMLLRNVIESRIDGIRFDFLTEQLRGIILRSTLVIKNIELNKTNSSYLKLLTLRINNDLHRPEPDHGTFHLSSDKM